MSKTIKVEWFLAVMSHPFQETFKEVLRSVSRTFEGCFKRVSKRFHASFKGLLKRVSLKFQECSKSASEIFQGRFTF